jgi:cobalt-zinc-cadmium efflux system protein
MTRTTRLWLVFAINGLTMIALAIVGFSSHSVGVLAAAGEYVADAAAIGLTLFALRLAKRPPSMNRSFGYHRATVLAALANTTFVLFIAVNVAIAAVRRLISGGANVQGGPAFVVSIVAMFAMGSAALLLMGDDDLSVRSVLLDTAADALAAGAVAASSAVIWWSGGKYQWLDPIVGLAVAAFVGWHAIRLVRETATVLLQWAPRNLDLVEVQDSIREFPGVVDLHDVHLWSLTADAQVLSAHVILDSDKRLSESSEIVAELKESLHERFGIEHVTLEVEFSACAPPSVCVSPIHVHESAHHH